MVGKRSATERALLLWFAALVVGGLAVTLGWLLALYLPTGLVAALKTISVGAAVWGLYELAISKWPIIWKYIRLAASEELREPFARLAVLMTGLGLAIGAEIAAPAATLATLQITSLLSDSAGAQGVVIRDRIVVPFFTSPVRGCTAAVAAAEGSRLSAELTDAITRAACGLRSCSTAGSPVRVDVRGYASDKDFDCPGDAGRQLNLAVAEARRDRILDALSTARARAVCPVVAGRELQIVPDQRTRWRDLEEMSRYRGTGGTGPAGDSAVLESWARRADVVVLSAGSCTLGN